MDHPARGSPFRLRDSWRARCRETGTPGSGERSGETTSRNVGAAPLADSHAWHHVKDVSLGEDGCKVRCGHAPDNLAVLRALALGFLGRLGQDTVPDAIRWVSYEAFIRPLDVIGLR